MCSVIDLSNLSKASNQVSVWSQLNCYCHFIALLNMFCLEKRVAKVGGERTSCKMERINNAEQVFGSRHRTD